MTAAPAPSTTTRSVALADIEALHQFLSKHRRLFVLTGAGCSTDSGIPDYRDIHGLWKRLKPVEYRPFMTEPMTRARYWARSLIGWRSFGKAAPNAAHEALASLERSGAIGLLVTQNVDGLHQAAGSHNVIDLHGRLDRVICMTCRQSSTRGPWQQHLESLNPAWATLDAPVAPDGDADLDEHDFSTFVVPDCLRCGGIVKPDVVFFGENVPPWRHTQATAALAKSDAMLVVGSSLMVYSGYRYAVAANRLGKPLAALNLGRTRADHLYALKVEAPAAMTLEAVLQESSSQPA